MLTLLTCAIDTGGGDVELISPLPLASSRGCHGTGSGAEAEIRTSTEPSKYTYVD